MTDFDQRYAEPALAYGAEPNDFLRLAAPHIPPGPVLCLAEGQGRNAVFIAGLGHEVLAVDRSAVGLTRAQGLAAERGVTIATEVADLATWTMPPGRWAGIVSIFGHVPSALRRRVHAQVVAGLMPGGVFILEAYRPAQLALGTGGPKDADLLPTLDLLRAELPGLAFVVAQDVERDVTEGTYHRGRAATVQLLARKP